MSFEQCIIMHPSIFLSTMTCICPSTSSSTPTNLPRNIKIQVSSEARVHKEEEGKGYFTPNRESYANLFQRLRQRRMITPLLGHTSNRRLRNFDPNARCTYHSDAQGHSIEDCRDLKREIEKMIQDGSIMV
ncbi:hypothetical protein P3L10_001156 [Capsicum annuum]